MVESLTEPKLYMVMMGMKLPSFPKGQPVILCTF